MTDIDELLRSIDMVLERPPAPTPAESLAESISFKADEIARNVDKAVLEGNKFPRKVFFHEPEKEDPHPDETEFVAKMAVRHYLEGRGVLGDYLAQDWGDVADDARAQKLVPRMSEDVTGWMRVGDPGFDGQGVDYLFVEHLRFGGVPLFRMFVELS